MYKSYKKEDWIKHLKIKEEDIPKGLIIFGAQNALKRINRWERKLHNSKKPYWNLVFGDYKGTEVGMTIVYGGAAVSEPAHIFSILGVKLIIQIGYFGALQKDMRVGDFFIPTVMEREEGVSDLYLGRNIKADSFNAVNNLLINECRKRNKKYYTGHGITFSSMLAETKEMVLEWSRKGYKGVDMETATVFSIAKSFNIARGAILSSADNLIEEKSFVDMSEEEYDEFHKPEEEMEDIALEVIRKF